MRENEQLVTAESMHEQQDFINYMIIYRIHETNYMYYCVTCKCSSVCVCVWWRYNALYVDIGTKLGKPAMALRKVYEWSGRKCTP